MAGGLTTTIGHASTPADRRVHRPGAVTLMAAALAGVPVAAQESSRLPGTDVVLENFGVSDPAALRSGRVAIVHAPDGLRLVVHYLRNGPPPAPIAPPVEVPLAEAADGASPAESLSALWVWNTAELLADPAERAAFLGLVETRGIDRVYLYVPVSPGLVPTRGFLPFDGSAVAPLVAELRAVGALTYALDGDPEYARPENHAGVLRTVERVAAHNRSVPPEERFYGVRLDVEPYLLPGFQGPRRETILRDYLRLITHVSAAAREAGLAFGVDIPFWLDGPDEVTGEPFEVVFDGVRRTVLDHLLPHVDDAAVMAYRTDAGGPDGVLSQARGEVARAGAEGVELFVGMETTRIYDEDLYTLRGSGRPGLPALTEAAWIVAQAGGDGSARFWFVEEGFDPATLADGIDPARGPTTYWYAGTPVPLLGSHLSFESLGAEALEAAKGELLEGFFGRGGFRGLAYHDYRGLKALLEGAGAAREDAARR